MSRVDVERPLDRRALAGLCAAVVLPIPLLSASGLSVPLPGFVERMAFALVSNEGGEASVASASPRGVTIARVAEDTAFTTRATIASRPAGPKVAPATRRAVETVSPRATSVAAPTARADAGDPTPSVLRGGGVPAGEDGTSGVEPTGTDTTAGGTTPAGTTDGSGTSGSSIAGTPQGGAPPDQGGAPPDQGTPPGQAGAPPDQGTPPGQGSPPGQGGAPPGQGGTPPGHGGTPPGQGTPPSNGAGNGNGNPGGKKP